MATRLALDPAALADPPRTGVHSVAGHLILLGVSALLLGLAFPRPGWGLLAHVALVPATILALRSTRVRRLLWTGYLVSLLWWLVRLSWLIGVTPGGYVALAAYEAIYFPLTLLLARFLHRRYRFAMVLALPLAWVSLELLRCRLIEGGFPWFVLGHSQAPYLPTQGAGRLVQVADLFGQYGVSFLVAMTNGFLVDVLSQPLFAGQPLAARTLGAAGVVEEPARRTSRAVVGAATLWIATIAGAWAYGQYRLSESRTRGYMPPPLRVVVVQTNEPQDNKRQPKPGDAERYFERMLDLSRDAVISAAPDERPDLIVWPETMVPMALNAEAVGYYRAPDPRVSSLQRYDAEIAGLARALHVQLLVGAETAFDWRPVTDPSTGDQFLFPTRRYNSVYLYRADGSQAPRRYDKVHRVPFGEYVPWVDQSPWLKDKFIRLLTPYDFDFTIRAGSTFTVFEVPPVTAAGTEPAGGGLASPARVATPICFEDAQPSVTRAMVYREGGRKDVDLLVNLTNDGWYPGSAQGYQHFQIAVFRCVEARVPMARSVNTGVSGFIDSNGRVTKLIERNGRHQLIDGWEAQEISFDSRRTFYGWAGDAPMWGLTAATALLAMGAVLRKER